MPVPLIELQRRLSLVGAIRAGGEKTNPKRPGAKLESWRITSPRKALVQQAAQLYGGAVTKWKSPVGDEWQCYTETPELPVLLMPSYSLRQTYELWEGATKRMRLCDGVDEEISGGPCICNQTGEDKCDLYTRLVVALPELDTLLGWRVITRGVNAAHELPTMIDAARATSERPFVPARLRLEQRRGVVDGTVARFVVPTLDLGVGYAALAAAAVDGSTLALPSGEGTTAAAVLPADEPGPTPETPDAALPSPPDTPGAEAASSADDGPVDEHRGHMASDEQKTKLNIMVAKLTGDGRATKDGLYDAIAQKFRGTAGLDLAMTTPDLVKPDGTIVKAIDEEGVCHWSPLRETLTAQEAHQLIEWLTVVERRPIPGSGAGDEPAAQATSSEGTPAPTPTPDDPGPDAEPSKPPPVPYNEFPEGY
jgi:hypothetical protein